MKITNFSAGIYNANNRQAVQNSQNVMTQNQPSFGIKLKFIDDAEKLFSDIITPKFIEEYGQKIKDIKAINGDNFDVTVRPTLIFHNEVANLFPMGSNGERFGCFPFKAFEHNCKRGFCDCSEGDIIKSRQERFYHKLLEIQNYVNNSLKESAKSKAITDYFS